MKLSDYSTKDFLEAGAYRKGMTIADLRHEYGWSAQSFYQIIKNDSMKVSVFRKVMEDILGYEMFFRDAETGEELYMGKDKEGRPGRRNGHGKRVRAQSKGVVFDTLNADAVADSFYLDGEHEYSDGFAQEVYVDREGRYFIVTYSDHIGDKDKLEWIDKVIADAFIQNYGRLEDRQKKKE